MRQISIVTPFDGLMSIWWRFAQVREPGRLPFHLVSPIQFQCIILSVALLLCPEQRCLLAARWIPS